MDKENVSEGRKRQGCGGRQTRELPWLTGRLPDHCETVTLFLSSFLWNGVLKIDSVSVLTSVYLVCGVGWGTDHSGYGFKETGLWGGVSSGPDKELLMTGDSGLCAVSLGEGEGVFCVWEGIWWLEIGILEETASCLPGLCPYFIEEGCDWEEAALLGILFSSFLASR